MTTPENAHDFLHDLRMRNAAEGGIFWATEDRLAVFEPGEARRVSAVNWRGLMMPDRFVDLIRRRSSPPVEWTRIRTLWLTRLRELDTAEHNSAMSARMTRVIDEQLGDDIDLVMLAQNLTMHAILPFLLTGLTPGETAWITEDMHQKSIRLINRFPLGRWQHIRFQYVQFMAGRVQRRVIRERANGRRPREFDLADPFVDLLPELGIDRALEVVSTTLVAVAGPPGAAAGSTLYELARNPEWVDRLTAELEGVDLAEFYTAPAKVAPITHRFVKEVLRMWSPPLMLARETRCPMDVGGIHMKEGQAFLMSPHMIHRDHRNWPEADTFDPDRFLPGAPHGPAGRGHYVPFGWEPKRCIGVHLGTLQLMELCRLMCTRYRLTVPGVDKITVAFRFAPVPLDFRGHLALR